VLSLQDGSELGGEGEHAAIAVLGLSGLQAKPSGSEVDVLPPGVGDGAAEATQRAAE
jgi:hypothetical protein